MNVRCCLSSIEVYLSLLPFFTNLSNQFCINAFAARRSINSILHCQTAVYWVPGDLGSEIRCFFAYVLIVDLFLRCFKFSIFDIVPSSRSIYNPSNSWPSIDEPVRVRQWFVSFRFLNRRIDISEIFKKSCFLIFG